jgi:hypothetical protein
MVVQASAKYAGFFASMGVYELWQLLQGLTFSLYWAYPCFASFSMLCTKQYSVKV